MFQPTTIIVLPGNRPEKSETCSSLIFKKYYCELNNNYVHLFVETVEKELESLTSRATGIVSTVPATMYLRYYSEKNARRHPTTSLCHKLPSILSKVV